MTEKNCFLLTLFPPREDFAKTLSPEEEALVGRHFEYLARLHAQSALFMAGRREDAAFGIAVLLADSEEEARQIAARDPAISAGIFRYTLEPFRLALPR